ncbi:hypothetical protein CSUI_009406 [Cystoisospora suis]|uniref:Uncharacterized protein n=1 Tax=Cystoisospora suis TaxID=483139 RepID=A0A2C6KGV6_9APIC|nr:hypothetical protein CSUI_009406 [Cystoisospora suis]
MVHRRAHPPAKSNPAYGSWRPPFPAFWRSAHPGARSKLSVEREVNLRSACASQPSQSLRTLRPGCSLLSLHLLGSSPSCGLHPRSVTAVVHFYYWHRQ